MQHARSDFSQEKKEKFFTPDRGLFDVKITRSKAIKKLVAVLCDTTEEPMCIVRLSNLLDRTVETYPYNMVIDHTVKAEKIVFHDVDSQKENEKIIGKLDEAVMTEYFNVWNDDESYHLRNFEADFSSGLLLKLVMYAKEAPRMFSVEAFDPGIKTDEEPMDAEKKDFEGKRRDETRFSSQNQREQHPPSNHN